MLEILRKYFNLIILKVYQFNFYTILLPIEAISFATIECKTILYHKFLKKQVLFLSILHMIE